MNGRMREMRERIVSLFTRDKQRPELDEELATHLAMAVEDNLRRGMEPSEAERQAKIRLGGLEQAKERVREQRGLPRLESLAKDLRYALRGLRKNPGFTFVAVLTLGLGIGANTAIFSIVEAVVLRALPYPEPENLVAIWESQAAERTSSPTTSGAGRPGQRMPVAPANLTNYITENRSFASIAGYESAGMNLTGSGTPERLLGERVTAEYFPVLGVQPAQGRAFLPEEDRPGNNRVIIVTHEFWQNRFGGDSRLLNNFLTLDAQRYQVIGIMPPGFQPLTQFGVTERVSFLIPAAYSQKLLAAHGDHEIDVVARLKPGASVKRSQADLDAISARLAQSYPDSNRNVRATTSPLIDDLTRNVRLSLLVLVGAVGLLLVIACTNLANLLMVRAINRQREIAMRIALGASRLRVLRELAIQNLVLAAFGGLAGLLLAASTKQSILMIAPANIPRLADMTLNGRVGLFTAGMSMLTGIFFTLFPSWQAFKASPIDSLKVGQRNSPGRTAMRWRSTLILLEVSLSMMLLVGAGLLLRSFISLQGVDLGFSTQHVLAMNINLPDLRYPDPERRLAFFEALSEKIGALPGVEAAAFANRMPMRGGWGGGVQVEVKGTIQENLEADMQAVNTGYFQTLGLELRRGRLLAAADRSGAPLVAVINAEFAKRFLAGLDPTESRIRRSPTAPWVSVVGVISDVHRDGKGKPVTPQVYFSAAQTRVYPVRLADFAFRASIDPRSLLTAVRKEVWSIDKNQPVTNVRILNEIVAASMAPRRFQTLLLLLFSGLAVTLAAIGIYGVISYGVSQRTSEIGVRMALGASQGVILRSIVGRSMLTVGAGIGLGLLGAFGLSS